MSDTVKIELMVVRDQSGKVACRNESREECLAFRRYTTEWGYTYDWDCGLDGASGIGDSKKQTYYPIADMDACPIVKALRTEGAA